MDATYRKSNPLYKYISKTSNIEHNSEHHQGLGIQRKSKYGYLTHVHLLPLANMYVLCTYGVLPLRIRRLRPTTRRYTLATSPPSSAVALRLSPPQPPFRTDYALYYWLCLLDQSSSFIYLGLHYFFFSEIIPQKCLFRPSIYLISMLQFSSFNTPFFIFILTAQL